MWWLNELYFFLPRLGTVAVMTVQPFMTSSKCVIPGCPLERQGEQFYLCKKHGAVWRESGEFERSKRVRDPARSRRACVDFINRIAAEELNS